MFALGDDVFVNLLRNAQRQEAGFRDNQEQPEIFSPKSPRQKPSPSCGRAPRESRHRGLGNSIARSTSLLHRVPSVEMLYLRFGGAALNPIVGCASLVLGQACADMWRLPTCRVLSCSKLGRIPICAALCCINYWGIPICKVSFCVKLLRISNLLDLVLGDSTGNSFLLGAEPPFQAMRL